MKVIGFVSVIVGLVLVAVSKVAILSGKLSFLPEVILNYSIYIGVVCILVGIVIFIITRNSSGSSVGKEVPIYHGKKIVGYRRH